MRESNKRKSYNTSKPFKKRSAPKTKKGGAKLNDNKSSIGNSGKKTRKPSTGRLKKSELNPKSLINRTIAPSNTSKETTRTFEAFTLQPSLISRLKAKKFLQPTKIQDKTLENILAGENIMGIANTGTGKTAAFLIPLIERLLGQKKGHYTLVLVPTRELAQQVVEEFKSLTKGLKLYAHCLIGGTNINKDIAKLRREAHMVIGTPGRINDMLNRKALQLHSYTNLVLDEFDTMLDMGFQKEVMRIVNQMPNRKQTILFSATQTNKQKRIIDELMPSFTKVGVSDGRSNTDSIYQDIIPFETSEEKNLILGELLRRKEYRKVLVFLDTKRQVTRLFRHLKKQNFRVDEIHGDKSQNYRSKAIQKFKLGTIQIMVATDVAARGIDIDDVSLVVNYHIPSTRESYIHRIGRTGRAGKQGQALTFIQK